jgi:ribosomal protein S18 acetylase RimI-like enzyme
LGEGQATRRGRDPGVVVRPARPSEIPAILALWREAEAVPSVSDDPASLRRLLATSEDALLVAEAAGPEAGIPDPGHPDPGHPDPGDLGAEDPNPGIPDPGHPHPDPGDPRAGGRLVGTIVAGWDGWRGNLYRLAVLPSARRRGIALRLVAEAERRLTEKGAVRLSALVMSEHDPAVALWRAAGYTHDPRVGRFVRSLR